MNVYLHKEDQIEGKRREAKKAKAKAKAKG